jgi:DNA gyrase/topoisomerase IV subunit A
MDCEAVCACACKIAQLDKNTLVITQIPFSTNTTTLIDSILKANEKGNQNQKLKTIRLLM